MYGVFFIVTESDVCDSVVTVSFCIPCTGLNELLDP